MKFQNCILINFVTDARTDGRTHARTSRNQYDPTGGIIKLDCFNPCLLVTLTCVLCQTEKTPVKLPHFIGVRTIC